MQKETKNIFILAIWNKSSFRTLIHIKMSQNKTNLGGKIVNINYENDN